MIKHKHSPVKLSGSVHKTGHAGDRTKADINPRHNAKRPACTSDMTPAAMKSNHCSKIQSRVNKRYGYSQTVFGNEAGKQ
jgi:hypothetical protein